jgi:hypothetical protein
LASGFRKLLSLIFIVAGVAAAQTAPPRKNIPAIAKAANGAIVSIVMSGKDGHPLAQGSGFLVSKDGLIVTNYHVIAEGTSAVVKFPDGAFYIVDGVLAPDKIRDLAIIKIHGKTFRTLTLGNSDRVQVGEEVVAIGNPLSLESTVSNGIVSGIRTVPEQGGKFLQTTAPISPGSSGGPLFNMRGEVIGVNTMYLKGGENLNFAIPVNDAELLLHINQSGSVVELRGLPDEDNGEATESKEAHFSEFGCIENVGGTGSYNRGTASRPAHVFVKYFVKYRVMAYNPNTRGLVIRCGNKVFALTVVASRDCVSKSLYDSPDCETVVSKASELVGRDIRSDDDYAVIEMRTGFDWFQYGDIATRNINTPGTSYHYETWKVEKVEEVNP